MSAQPPGHSYETDSTLYLFTSLTAGSSHIITATSRLETILKANRIPFNAIDTATDEKARRIWVRRAQGRKLPGMVREGMVLADLEQIEEWNEYGELKEKLGSSSTSTSTSTPSQPTTTSSSTINTNQQSAADPSAASATVADSSSTSSNTDTNTSTMRQLGQEAAAKAQDKANPNRNQTASSSTASSIGTGTNSNSASLAATQLLSGPAPETMTSSPEAKKQSIRIAEERHALKERGNGRESGSGERKGSAVGEGEGTEREEAEVVKTQNQDAKDGEEAGTSVMD